MDTTTTFHVLALDGSGTRGIYTAQPLIFRSNYGGRGSEIVLTDKTEKISFDSFLSIYYHL